MSDIEDGGPDMAPIPPTLGSAIDYMGASKGPQAPDARQRPGEAVALLGRR